MIGWRSQWWEFCYSPARGWRELFRDDSESEMLTIEITGKRGEGKTTLEAMICQLLRDQGHCVDFSGRGHGVGSVHNKLARTRPLRLTSEAEILIVDECEDEGQ